MFSYFFIEIFNFETVKTPVLSRLRGETLANHLITDLKAEFNANFLNVFRWINVGASYLIFYHLDLKNGIAGKELDEHMSIKWLSPTVTKISIKRNSELKQNQKAQN